MNQSYNWSEFYKQLCQYGPDLLTGIDEDTREIIKEISSTTDMFWSENLQEFLIDDSFTDSLRDRVLLVLDEWKNNVIDSLDVEIGMELETGSVSINTASPIIDSLIGASRS